jgi:hypothetical protein
LLLLVGTVGFLLTNIRQLTSEIGRVWLIVIPWFAHGTLPPSAWRAATVVFLPSVTFIRCCGAVLIGTMLITRDMGPLLIAGYGAAPSWPSIAMCALALSRDGAGFAIVVDCS